MSVELFKPISLEIYRPGPSRQEEELTISRELDPNKKMSVLSSSLVRAKERVILFLSKEP
jgi:hypothetical protein